jgi:hypothetical protein
MSRANFATRIRAASATPMVFSRIIGSWGQAQSRFPLSLAIAYMYSIGCKACRQRAPIEHHGRNPALLR